MTRDKAIIILENEKPSCGEKIVYKESERYEAYNIAIEALRREIPKNPVINFIADSDGSRRLNDGWTDDALLCPVCHSYVGSVFNELYCGTCGQKIVQKRVRVIV